ncbi:hypothetical protein [Wolbachia endosymbiont (group A) of Urophora cardui]|uniref:hypothetical protein n=1 Tax=Wolbachia endosymbiont (group A) of Urophora cardui TaxID=3066156 RepID=UPI003979CA3F
MQQSQAVLQEFWANLVMCNILSLHMCDAQGPSQIKLLRNFSVLFGVIRQSSACCTKKLSSPF